MHARTEMIIYFKLIDMKGSSTALCIFISVFYFYSCSSSNTGTSQISTVDLPKARSVFINGDSIHYIEIGKGDPVVFVHGSLGDYRTWGRQLDTFAKKYRVIAYSRRYAYPNNKIVNDSADYSVIQHAKDLTEFLKVINAGPVHLIGHSYGASIILSTAMEHPELVKSLTLGEPPVVSLLFNVPGGDTIVNNFVKQVMIPAGEAFKANDSIMAVRLFIGGVMGDSTYYSRISSHDLEIIMANTLETRGSMVTKDPFPSVGCEDLKKIKAPVLLVMGDKSPSFFSSVIGELERCLPNREKATLANTSHGLEYENPAEFNEKVLEFLDKH